MVTEAVSKLVVRTNRLLLRCSQMSDVDALYEMQKNEEVMKYLYNVAPDKREFVRKELEKRIADSYISLIILLLPPEHYLSSDVPVVSDVESDPSLEGLLATDQFAGSIGMRHTRTLGYVVPREHWGIGIATEAVQGILALIWDQQTKWEAGGRQGEGPWGDVPRAAREEHGEEREFVSATFNPENVASARVMVKAGGVFAGSIDVDDWEQTAEDRERDGVRKFKLDSYRFWRP